MNVETFPQSYSGVRCLSCRQPIPLPAILFRMGSKIVGSGSDSALDHPIRVFSLRCRACEREKPYRTSDITNFEGTPRARLSRSLVGRAKHRLFSSPLGSEKF
jgi:hypothetical protein